MMRDVMPTAATALVFAVLLGEVNGASTSSRLLQIRRGGNTRFLKRARERTLLRHNTGSSSSSSLVRRAKAETGSSKDLLEPTQTLQQPGMEGKFWDWRGHSIRYQEAKAPSSLVSKDDPVVILVHGFGGNADHWRKNIPEVSKYADTYAIDLLGYGFSAKPTPPAAYPSPEQIYTFETWGEQLRAFSKEVAGVGEGRKVYYICNSVGSVAGLQAAVLEPDSTAGVMLLDPSLRLLHWSKQPFLQRPLTSLLQTTLRETQLGRWFFGQVATPKGVRSVLEQAYHDKAQVTDELVNFILNPGLLPGAVDVFLDFISYSGGPLPEELIPQLKCPVQIVWGEEDPWEPLEMGRRTFGGLKNIEKFITLPGVGHCPMDEAPQLVNPLIHEFVSSSQNK